MTQFEDLANDLVEMLKAAGIEARVTPIYSIEVPLPRTIVTQDAMRANQRVDAIVREFRQRRRKHG